MRYPEFWAGTLEENRTARWNIANLIHQLSIAEDCTVNDCCDDKDRRYRINSETGVIDVSMDGGEVWDEAPGTIYSGAVTPVPLPGLDGDVKRCEAANNVVDNLKDVQAGIATKIGLGEDLFDLCVEILIEIVALILAGVVGASLATLVLPLIPKILEVARGITGLSEAGYNALFTEAVWTTTRCIMFCHVGANGKFTAAAWSAVKVDLKNQLGAGATQAGANLAAMVDVWALPGLNHAAQIGAGTEGNCDDCDCAGCDLSGWVVSAGTELSRTTHSITAEASEVSPGDWSVQLTSTDPDTCCCNMTYQLLSGGVTITAIGWVPCGHPLEDYNFSYSGQSLRWYDLATHGGTFTVKITASDCGG